MCKNVCVSCANACMHQRNVVSIVCDSFSWDPEETTKKLLLKQQQGVAIHCRDNSRPLLYFGGNICLPVSTSVNSLHYSGRDQRELRSSCAEGRRASPSGMADVTTHFTAMHWCGFSVNMAMKNAFWEEDTCGEDKIMT